MDPVSLAAVVGLVFAGKRISDAKEEQQEVPAMLAPQKVFRKDLVQYDQFAQQDMQLDSKNMTPDIGRGFSGDWRMRPKEIAPNMGDIVKDGKRFPFGQPVYDVTYRENVTNKMNNLNPTQKVYVGRGLGLDPNTPAAGGFQQFFRIEPTNMNEEKLTQLPGTWGGPADSLIKSGGTTMGAITHQAKPTKAWHRDPTQNRGQGQGGAITAPEGRPDFQKTRRTTNRQETGYRDDTLGAGPAQYSVGQGYDSGLYNNGMTRGTGNRVNPDRAANPGGMNVRQDPVGMIGAGTTTRLEAGPLPLTPGDGSRTYRYVPPQYNKVNVFKENTIKTDLNLARDVRAKNPLAQPAFADYAAAA
jgi:hypothetical protein